MDKETEDLGKINAAIEQLKTAGADLFSDEIAKLQSKADELQAKISATVDGVKDDIAEAEQTFVEKYGKSILEAAKIILLVVIAARLFR